MCFSLLRREYRKSEYKYTADKGILSEYRYIFCVNIHISDNTFFLIVGIES
jgi:hypothetical protein